MVGQALRQKLMGVVGWGLDVAVLAFAFGGCLGFSSGCLGFPYQGRLRREANLQLVCPDPDLVITLIPNIWFVLPYTADDGSSVISRGNCL